MRDRKVVIDPDTNLTYVDHIKRHDERPENKSWKAVEKPIEKTEDEKIREFLVTNKNMPHPNALLYRPRGNHDPDIEVKPGRKIVFDEKGHPIKPSNQAKYWKLVRKARRLNNRG
jgi:mRNA degradation ribonuclease J1/J2